MASIKNQALQKLEQYVEEGKTKAIEGIQKLSEEFGIRKDYMVRPQAVEFSEEDVLTPIIQGEPYRLTRHSRTQLLSRASIPTTFADNLERFERSDLLRYNLKELLPQVSREGILFRTVRDTAKGILSSSYRRMDASPLFEGYAAMSLKTGLVPFRGDVTDTRAYLSFIQPKVIELVKNEYIIMGTEFRSSDYGRGALTYNLTILRLLCKNGMIGMDIMRKVHLGRRFDNDSFDETGVIQLSTKTMELDTRTIRSALGDAIVGMDTHMKALQSTIQEKAAKEEVNLSAALDRLKKSGLKKETLEKVKTLYESELPVEALPEKPGLWRLANVVSMIANESKGDDHLDLQDAAMSLLVSKRVA